jgi:hypothetical protein
MLLLPLLMEAKVFWWEESGKRNKTGEGENEEMRKWGRHCFETD